VAPVPVVTAGVPASRMGRLAAGWSLLGLLPLVVAGCGGAADPQDYQAVSSLRRELAVAKLTVPNVVAARARRCAVVAKRDGGVFVPWNGRLLVHVDLPPRPALRIGSLARCGDGDGRLRIVAATDRAGSTRGELGAVPGVVAARLPPLGGPARLELSAVPVGSGAASAAVSGGFVLRDIAVGAREKRPDAGARRSALPRRPHVLVYLVDALRRDGLGCYGGRRGVSPHLDRLAAEAAVFDDAVAQGSWTRPAVASLLTGLTPASHGVLGRRQALSEDAVTLGERLQAAGYRTLGLVANGNVGGKLGFRQGFDSMKQLLSGPRHKAAGLVRELLHWVDEASAGGRPFFAYLHTVEPHGPYEPVEPYRSRFAPGVPVRLGSRASLREIELAEGPPSAVALVGLRALYDAEVAAADAAFGDLRAGLERRGLWEDTVVLVLADHGEEFYEHGRWEHGSNLHGATLSIPLLIRVPGVAGRHVERVAQQIDLTPTVLELAGVSVPSGLDGESLVDAIAGEVSLAPAAARSYHEGDDGEEVAVTTNAFRLLVFTRADRSTTLALYERRRDPRERRDLSVALPITTAYLRSVLRWPNQGQGTLARRAGRLSREAEEQLRALGYVH